MPDHKDFSKDIPFDMKFLTETNYPQEIQNEEIPKHKMKPGWYYINT